MEIKAVHFDMKSMIPAADYALTLLDELSEQGFNAVLVEFEDKYPFEVTAGTHHPCAWTKKEFRAFADRCKARNLELIPLLQSAGHLDYLLKYPKFRSLRDGGAEGSTYQWCLALEESFELWRAMADELLEVFPETKFFHIGADECRMDLPCKLCGENRLDLYIKRVARCAEYIQSKNRKVVLWDDVFRKYGEEKFALLPQGVIPCIWMYGELDLDYIGRMAASGLEFWGASCIQACHFYQAMAPQEPEMRNVDDWGKVHEMYPQISGHIGTIWGRNQCQSPINVILPQSMFMTAYLAETLNNGVVKDRGAFMRLFGKTFFGTDIDCETMLNSFCYIPTYAEPLVAELKEKAPRHRDIAEIWHGLNAVDLLLCRVFVCLSHSDSLADTFRKGMAPREMTGYWKKELQRCKEDTRKALAELRPQMVKYFPGEMWDEYADQHFKGKFEVIDHWLAVHDQASLKWEENLRKC